MAPQKTVLITGCSQGSIGDDIAQSFHKLGLRVFATARNLSKVQHLKDLGMNIVVLDVSDVESVEKAVAVVKAATGGTLDVLVNNAGVAYPVPILDAELEQTKKMFDVNVFGVLAVTQAFVPLLMKSKGVIVNIGSISGVVPNPWQGVYSASKAAANQLSDNMRLELEPFGVRVVLVCLGVVRTNFFNNRPLLALPETSLYAIDKDYVESHMSGSYYDNAMTIAADSAEQIARNALKRSPKSRQWVGGQSFLAWLTSSFTPLFLQHIILYYKFGLHRIHQKFKQAVAVSK